MIGQSSAPIQHVIIAILNNVESDKMALFALLHDHPMLQEAQAFARDGQPERFLYALPYPNLMVGNKDRSMGAIAHRERPICRLSRISMREFVDLADLAECPARFPVKPS